MARDDDPFLLDDETIADITPDVMGALKKDGYFGALDDLLCPVNPATRASVCRHDWKLTEAILIEREYPAQDISDVIQVLQTQGACCDCEVLYNVAEESRLRGRYWKARAEELEKEAKSEGRES